jgi:undecaprenyl-diphosphatase
LEKRVSIFEALVLGIVQGAAEFLPISSSGHLVLVPWWLGWDHPPLLFDVTVHVGTALAVLVYFWQEWIRIMRAGLNMIRKRAITNDDERLAFYLLVGNIPAGLLGFFLDDLFESAFTEIAIVASMLLVTAGILLVSERFSNAGKSLKDINLSDVLMIGLAQALAIMPGISRSGSTIAAGLMRKLSREDAAHFSFLLGTPIILAAGFKQVLQALTTDGIFDEVSASALIVGFVASALVGYACIGLLLQFVRRQPLYFFVAYCAAFGISTLAALLIRG